jgi:aryl-alcohol dehydrogenase-like predicted oxidoreductase
MEYRKFGDADLEVSVVGFGGWPMGGTQYGTVDDTEGERAVQRALDAGITCFDNAAGYGLGHSEQVMGSALKGHRNDVIIITKCGIEWNNAEKRMGRNGTRTSILTSAENSLRNLETDYIDLLLVHWPDLSTPFEETMRALEELQKAGKIRYAGVSNFLPDMMEECRKHLNIITNQVGYSLFERRPERDIISYCEDNSMGIMSYGSLAHGLLAGNMTKDTQFESWDWRSSEYAFGMPFFQRGGHFENNVEIQDRLRGIAELEGRTLPDLALAWVLSHKVITTALVGFRTPAEVEDAVNASEWNLPPDLLDEVTAISDQAFQRMVADEQLSSSGGWNPWNIDPPQFAGGGKSSVDEDFGDKKY